MMLPFTVHILAHNLHQIKDFSTLFLLFYANITFVLYINSLSNERIIVFQPINKGFALLYYLFVFFKKKLCIFIFFD